MACVLNSCCGYIDLRRGSFIIAYINMIFGISSFAVIAFGPITVPAPKDSELKDVPDGTLTVSIVITVFNIMLHFLLLTFTIILLFGLHQNKRKHVNAYVRFSIGFLIVYIILGIVNTFQSTIVVIQLVADIISFVTGVYFLLVIRSYYLQMVEEKNAARVNYSTVRSANV